MMMMKRMQLKMQQMMASMIRQIMTMIITQTRMAQQARAQQQHKISRAKRPEPLSSELPWVSHWL